MVDEICHCSTNLELFMSIDGTAAIFANNSQELPSIVAVGTDEFGSVTKRSPR
jgi:hypothetical protein